MAPDVQLTSYIAGRRLPGAPTMSLSRYHHTSKTLKISVRSWPDSSPLSKHTGFFLLITVRNGDEIDALPIGKISGVKIPPTKP